MVKYGIRNMGNSTSFHHSKSFTKEIYSMSISEQNRIEGRHGDSIYRICPIYVEELGGESMYKLHADRIAYYELHIKQGSKFKKVLNWAVMVDLTVSSFGIPWNNLLTTET
jgi:hypothetical protein